MPFGGRGLSWGIPGFRIGISPFGRRWMAISLPFGFRYFTYLGSEPFERTVPDPKPGVSHGPSKKIRWRKLR
jgi:hypothetical protein